MSTSKVWYHTGAPCNGCGGIGEMWRQLDAAGVPFGVYSVEGGGLIAEAAAYPGATLIYRTLRTDVAPYDLSPPDAAAFTWETLMTHLPPEVRALRGRVWLEIGNEQDKARADWLGHYYAELAAIALPTGYNIAGPGWATGEPEPEHWNLPGWARYLELCAAHPDRLAVTVHEYSLSADDIMSGAPWLVGRVKFLYEACRFQGVRPPSVFVTEAGWTHNDLPHPDKARADIAALAELYAAYPTVRAAFLWTLIGGGDKRTLAAELNALMPWLTEYAITTRLPDMEEPEPEPVANLLRNPSFEAGWRASDDYSTTQNPTGWTVEWNIGPQFANPHGGQAYLLGECVHKSKGMLPPAERHVFVWDGDWSLKVFAGDRSFWVRLKQTVDLPAGRYRLTTPVWVDCYRWRGFKDYNVEPWQAETMVKANGREVKAWALMVSGTRAQPVTVFDHAGGLCALAVHFRCNWAISNNLWLDGWSLERMTEPQPPPPAPSPVKVLDISKWQGTIDAAAMMAAGVDGVMVRASYAGVNGSRADEKVEEFIPLLRAAGVPYGLYHYFHPARGVDEQFEAFRAVVERMGYSMRLALDLEETTGFDANTPARAAALAERIRMAFPLPAGKRQIIYTSLGYWRDRLGSPAWGADFDLWIAAWTNATAPIVPAPWTRWTLWQYTNEGDGAAHGVGSERVDLNRFNGDRAAFSTWRVDAPPVTNPAAQLWALGQGSQVVARNPQFALEGAMVKAGYYPIGNETRATVGGVAYAFHLGANAGGAERLYVAKVPDWANVWYQDGLEAAPPAPDDRIDLLPYLRGDGRVYRLSYLINGQTGQQTVQTQQKNGRFYHVKSGEYEELWNDANFIYRGIDTSPGGGLYYVQRQNVLLYGARWCPRYWTVGAVYERNPLVTFYRKSDCKKVDDPAEGYRRTWLKFAAKHATWNGVADVIELHWLPKLDGPVAEKYWYGLGRGLVGWEGGAGRSWWIGDGGTAPVMEVIGCL